VALYVSKGVLQEWFGGNDLDAEESRLERFDVVIGRGISRQGNETIGAQYRLADDVIKDGDELYLVAERDVYDEFNTGIRIVFKFQ
jgi:translocation and assembly module TamB